MIEEHYSEAQKVQPGMTVQSSKGDLGQEDVSPPKVKDVIRGRNGEVETVIVEKGTLFRKDLEIPADRVQQVDPQQERGQVTVDMGEDEIESLSATGRQLIAPEEEERNQQLLGQIEQVLPTAEGVRRMEAGHDVRQEELQPKNLWTWLRQLGPGLLGGLSGNDSSAVTAYAIDGAQSGFGHLWLLLLSTPMYQAVLYTCAKIGRVTEKGFAEVVREHYGRPVAMFAAIVLIVANLALITADLVAIGSGFMLITGIDWAWFVLPTAAVLWYLVTYSSFEAIKKIFIVMSFTFFTYLITAILTRANWSSVLLNTIVPHLDLSFASISSAVALLGATITPYTMFWQVQGEKEEKRPGTLQQKLHFVILDIATGAIGGNLIAYFIIVSTAATLFVHHKNISTAADAAAALTPLLGPFAKYLFAIGLIGAGVVAIPILLASTSYAVTGTIGWPAGLSKLPWQNEGFYLILTGTLVISMVLALLHMDPIRLIFWANIINGILAPLLVVFLFLLANNRKIMGKHRVSLLTNGWLVLTFLVLVVGAALLFYGLATGQQGS